MLCLFARFYVAGATATALADRHWRPHRLEGGTVSEPVNQLPYGIVRER
jgi:hypothetical protein